MCPRTPAFFIVITLDINTHKNNLHSDTSTNVLRMIGLLLPLSKTHWKYINLSQQVLEMYPCTVKHDAALLIF